MTLQSHGADINAQSNFGLAIVDIAISKGYKDLVEFLLENNACPCLGLNMAIVRDFKEIFELLLSKGADVNVEDPDENTPLHVAILEANTNMVISLLSHGADVNKVNKKTGLTPLMLAVNLNTEEATIVDYLLSYKADHNVIDHYGETPLHIAIKQSKYYVAQVLLNHKVDINIRNASEETPLHTAIKYSIDGIEFLVEHSEHEIDINAKDKYGNTPLHTAAANFTVNYRDGRISLYSLVEYMIKHGADVNAKNQDGNTPLHVATNCGNLRDNVSNFQIVEVLRRNGASVFTKNNNGETPFSGLKPDVRKEYIARTGQGNSGCFIATACYGSPNCQEIIVLQRFRDEYLLKSILGSIFVFLYYQTSPPIASFIGEREGLRSFIRKYVIQPIVNVLYKHLGYF